MPTLKWNRAESEKQSWAGSKAWVARHSDYGEILLVRENVTGEWRAYWDSPFIQAEGKGSRRSAMAEAEKAFLQARGKNND